MEFDSSRLSCEELLDCFFRMHDPTTLNRQHNDVGTNRPIVTGTAAAGKLHPAADYHQEYLVKHQNPGGSTCYVWRESKPGGGASGERRRCPHQAAESL